LFPAAITEPASIKANPAKPRQLKRRPKRVKPERQAQQIDFHSFAKAN
jgi:hypothetical protein